MEVLLGEQEIASDLARAFGRRFLDERFFYWLPSSVQAWVELCSAAEYRNANRALNLLREAAPSLPQGWPEMKTLCGVGCGEGSKDRVLLDAYAAQNSPLAYVAADFSQALIELALESAAPAARALRGVKLDVMRDQHLAALAVGENPCIYAVLGNTLGAFDPAAFPARLRRILKPADRVLFDGELFAGEETLRGYDNPSNRRFAFAPLAGLGLTEDDGDLRFELASGAGGLHEVSKHFVARRDLELKIGGAAIAIAAGEKLRMSSSIKYADESVLRSRIEAGMFHVEHSWKSPDGKFVLAAAAPR
ncbi:MAG: L-histidine N(alpha)-methyltransferase [Terriglobales bacterium]